MLRKVALTATVRNVMLLLSLYLRRVLTTQRTVVTTGR